MNNAELVAALRWCQKHGCSKCVALLDNGSCKYGGAIKILDAAADALEAADKRIAEQQKQIARLYLLLNNKINEITKLKAQLPGVSEWKNQYGDGNWHCSKCGAIVEKDEQERHYWQWCYHCGSKMRKG